MLGPSPHAMLATHVFCVGSADQENTPLKAAWDRARLKRSGLQNPEYWDPNVDFHLITAMLDKLLNFSEPIASFIKQVTENNTIGL